MALGKNLATGRFDASQTPIMKRIRKPRFVDNAVRHGVYSKKQGGFVVDKPTQSDFLPTHDRKYRLIEEEDTVRLLHNPSDGHRYEGAIYSSDDKVSTASTLPALFVGADDIRQLLAPSKIEDAGKGTRYRIENIKGKELAQIGFTNKTVHISQKVGVGLRTSDLASRILNATTSSINGVVIDTPSSTFIAHDFYGVDAVSALRYISKHDSHLTKGDQFGNIHYSSQRQYRREHMITDSQVAGGSDSDQSDSLPNRVVVRGKPRANNDANVVQVDDLGAQSTSVNEIPGGIHVPTAVTKASARQIGRKVLSMAKNAVGSKRLNDVKAATHIHPGDAVTYISKDDTTRKVILSAKYDLNSRSTDLHINSVESTLEDVIQRFQEVDVSGSFDDGYERNRQFSVEEFSTSFGFNIKSTWTISTRENMNRGVGLIIGQVARSEINGARRLRSTGVLINNAGGYPVGTTSFTTDGTAANSVFTAGVEVYRSNGSKIGHVQSSTPTNVTITLASHDLVLDNEELKIQATSSYPEANNAHLKLGFAQGKYLRNRRG
tara:strand:+ start:1720 stop:3366 length:1647 start_codon:yes stop_codon:yes gene_type:complete